MCSVDQHARIIAVVRNFTPPCMRVDRHGVRKHLADDGPQRVREHVGALVPIVHTFPGAATAADHQLLGAHEALPVGGLDASHIYAADQQRVHVRARQNRSELSET